MSLGVGVTFNFNKLGGGGGAAPNPDFVSTWDTTKAGSSSDTVVLPLLSGGTYSGTIDWGDSSSDSLSYANRTHTFATAGTYTITITGQIEGFTFNNGGDKLKILDISNWGTVAFTGNYQQMRGCTNLDISATDAPDVSGVIGFELQGFFYGCTSLTTPDFSAWDVSMISNFASMFAGGLTTFNGDLSTWDMSSATTIEGMFNGCSIYNQPMNDWDVSNVLTTVTCFYKNYAFNQNIGAWRLTSCTNCQDMFYNCNAFNNGGSADIDGWDVSNVATWAHFLRHAHAFNQPIGSWDMSSSLNLLNFMYNASQVIPFDQDVSSWDVNQMTNLSNLFAGIVGFSTANYDALLIAWDAQGAMSYSGTVNFGGSKYTSGGAAETARTSLISKWGGITDGGAA
jgi:hypothetical protein